jgi:transposase
LGKEGIRPGFCWTHVRRKFCEPAESSPAAVGAVRLLSSLDAIEDQIRSLCADERRDARGQRSRPIIDER